MVRADVGKCTEGDVLPCGLEFGKGLDQKLVQRDKIRPLGAINDDIRQIDEEPLLIIEHIRCAVPHGGNEEIPVVGVSARSDSNPDCLPFGHEAPGLSGID